ncbi:MAG: YhbY family RNA-binding protein [Thermoplasmatota archaeon]|nr:YhbY family RNA-binding protein [Halobacteriales archaeon]
MDRLDPDRLREKRALANQLDVTLHVGKNGVTDATVAELKAQLHKKKLVKVRLLKSATGGGEENEAQADLLAARCDAQLVEVRGHTAVFWRS